MIETLEELDKAIADNRRAWQDLKRRRRKLIDGHLSEEESAKLSFEAACSGVSIKDISIARKITESTVHRHLELEVFNICREMMLAEDAATVIRPNKFGGETWNYDFPEHRRRVREFFRTRLPQVSKRWRQYP